MNSVSWIDIISLIFSSIAIYISYRSYKKQYPNLKITVNEKIPEEAFFYSNSIYMRIKIYNPSSIPINIESIELDKFSCFHVPSIVEFPNINFNRNSFPDFIYFYGIHIKSSDFVRPPIQNKPYEYNDFHISIPCYSRDSKTENNYFYTTLKVYTSSDKIYKKNVKIYKCLDCKMSYNKKNENLTTLQGFKPPFGR